jgi:hypothetical protein
MVIFVAALKISMSASSQGSLEPAKNDEGQSIEAKAIAAEGHGRCISRSGILSPLPKAFGLHTIFQLTSACPPEAFSALPPPR